MVDQVLVYTPKDYAHSQAFAEVARGFHDAFLEIKIPKDGKSLLFGANLAPHVPENFIIYQAEQVCRDSSWMTPGYLNALQTHEVWDYSLKNIEALAALGIKAKHVPIGYMPSMSFIQPSFKDIDVLHYGSLNERRKSILLELEASGVKIYHAFNCYGRERDALIARSKIVINIHYYESCIFEIFRVSHLMSNKVCVVSEAGNDVALENPYKDGIVMCSYDKLVSQCQELLSQPDNILAGIGEKGFNLFSTQKQTDILKEVMQIADV